MANPSIEKPYDMVHVRNTRNGKDGFGPFSTPPDAGNLFPPPPPPADIAPRKRAVQNRADVKTSALIYEKLKEVLVDHGDGTWSYRDGWDDPSLAIALRCNSKSVAYRREKIFGPLPEAPATPDKTAARALDLVLNLYKLLGQEVPAE